MFRKVGRQVLVGGNRVCCGIMVHARGSGTDRRWEGERSPLLCLIRVGHVVALVASKYVYILFQSLFLNSLLIRCCIFLV